MREQDRNDGQAYNIHRTGQRLGKKRSGIPYDRTGWTNRREADAGFAVEPGALKPLVILFARDIEFVELELERRPHPRIEARPEDIRVKAGLEFLERESIAETAKGWRVRFLGPWSRRWREGVQALFVATVPKQFLAEGSTPWVLQSVRWREDLP